MLGAMFHVCAPSTQIPCCRCVVIEDSQIGLRAAKAAGMRCIVTESRYTAGEDFDSADAVVDCIGDAGEERFSLDDLTAAGMMPEVDNTDTVGYLLTAQRYHVLQFLLEEAVWAPEFLRNLWLPCREVLARMVAWKEDLVAAAGVNVQGPLSIQCF